MAWVMPVFLLIMFIGCGVEVKAREKREKKEQKELESYLKEIDELDKKFKEKMRKHHMDK